MIPVKNKSKGKRIRMHPGDDRLLDCWLCGKPQHESDGTAYMHPRCWERATEAQRIQAEKDTDYGVLHELTVIYQGCGGVQG